jgi:hypothetical protein
MDGTARLAPERQSPISALRAQFHRDRAFSLALAGNLSDEDASAQSMADASPVIWRLAHTTWFFEAFVLRDRFPHHSLFDSRFPFLFKSYYEAEGARIARVTRLSHAFFV